MPKYGWNDFNGCKLEYDVMRCHALSRITPDSDIFENEKSYMKFSHSMTWEPRKSSRPLPPKKNKTKKSFQPQVKP